MDGKQFSLRERAERLGTRRLAIIFVKNAQISVLEEAWI